MCFRKSVLLVILCFIVSGCAAKGAQFSKLSVVPEGESVIYVYRPWAMIAAGANFEIVINGKRISPRLSNQSYLMYVTPPGSYKIHTNTMNIDRVLNINTAKNKSYFVSISIKHYFAAVAQIPSLVDTSLAIKEMKKCKLAL